MFHKYGNSGEQNLETYLNTQALNQALLQCKIGKVYDVIIDENEWIADDLIVEDSCMFKDVEVLEKFNNEFKKQYPIKAKKRGIVLFLSPLRKKEAGGEGEINEIDAKRLVVYQSNLWKKETFAHEISHVLGLTHPFQEKVGQKKINEYDQYIIEIDDYFNSLLKNKTPETEIAKEWSYYKNNYRDVRSYLNLYYRNPYMFDKKKTENIMDYSNKKKSFWKYQWKAMQDDIIKFYNVKK